MSDENIDLVRRAYGAFQTDDLNGFLACFDPAVELTSVPMETEGTFFGHAGMREWWRELRGVFPDWTWSLVEVRAVGPHVIVHGRGSGHGASSGIGVDSDVWQVAEVQQRRIVRLQAFRTRGEALEAAGLSESLE